MKNRFLHILIALLVASSALFVASCSPLDRSAKQLQKQLDEREALALKYTEAVKVAVQNGQIDALRRVAENNDGILFYVFEQKKSRVVYWSDNWLAGEGHLQPVANRWFYHRFGNAHAICRWTDVGKASILTVVPIKYAYRFESQQLHNTYIAPFEADQKIAISRTRKEKSVAVKDPDGRPLFYMYRPSKQDTEAEADDPDALAEAAVQRLLHETDAQDSRGHWAYKKLFSSQDDKPSHGSIHFFIILCVAFFIFMLAAGAYGLVRCGGLSNMKLQLKFQYLIVSVLLLLFVYVFWVSIRYVSTRYEDRQTSELLFRARAAQTALKNTYYLNRQLSPQSNMQSMNADLRILAYDLSTDINVYDNYGRLVGSSSPAIFDSQISIAPTLLTPNICFDPNLTADPTATSVRDDQIGDLQYRAAYTAFINGYDDQIGYIEIPLYVAHDEQHMAIDDFLMRLFPPYLLVMILSVILSLFLSRRITTPLNQLSEAIKHVEVGKRNQHLDYEHHDEVGLIVEQYNQMLDQLADSMERQKRAEREMAWRTMARQIAHEINNMLTPMKLNIQLLQRLKASGRAQVFDEKFDTTTASLIGNIDSLSNIATSFSTYAKMPEVKATEVDIAAQLFSVISLFRENQENTAIRYIGAEAGILAQADAEQIRQVFTNLLKNALQAINGAPGGDIIVILKDLGPKVEISVNDNGPGIPPDIQERVFIPYFTTKSAGTGLGLGISKNIVEGCGGKIWFRTSSQGTTFFVALKK